MSDEDGKQLSIEEAVQEADAKPKKSQTPEVEAEPARKSSAVLKARATNDDKKGKQLALEETIGRPDQKKQASPSKEKSPKQTTRSIRAQRGTRM